MENKAVQNDSPISSAPAVISTQPVSKRIQFRKKLDVPPAGLNKGTIIDVNALDVKVGANGKNQLPVELVIELDGLNAKGEKFKVSKTYNFYGRGTELLQEDLEGVVDEPLVFAEDGEFEAGPIIGKVVLVEIKNHIVGKKVTTTIEAFRSLEAMVEVK